MTERGPLVLPAAHQGAVLYIVGVLQFVGAMAAAQAYYPGYSDVSNAISDLGNLSRSPAHLLFAGSIILLGVLGLLGTLGLRTAFRPRNTSRIGLALLGAALLGAIGVGVFPEGSPRGLHTLFSSWTFLTSGFSLVVLALAMLRDTRWERMRLYTLASGIVTLAAIAVLASPLTTGGNFGAVERVVVAPILLWATLTGVHLLRIPALHSVPDRPPTDVGSGPPSAGDP